MTDKTIFSNDAEVAVLSIILNNPDMVYELDGLKSFMFSALAHQALYLEIEQMIEKQIPTEPALIISQLESSNEISRVGGKKYIEQLTNYIYNKDTLPQYRNLLMNQYKARSLVSLASSKATPDKININAIDDEISQFKLQLDKLMETRGGLQTFHVGDTVKSVYEEILSRQANPGIRGSTWGVEKIDVATGGKCPGELIIIGGRPGSGKSALVFNSIMQDAKSGVPSLLFEREMRNQEVVERLVSIETGIPITNIRLGILTKPQVELIYDSLGKIKQLPIYIDTSYRASDPYYLEATVNKYKNLHGIKNIYLDYLQLLVERDDGQTNALGRVSRLFKTLCNELDICGILLSQLNRGVENRDDKRPVLSDLRQSGNLEEDADIVVGLYRDGYYNKDTKFKNMMEFIILKYRNGPVGTISVKFEEETNKITGLGV